uniref:Uncharacterized protein n=1 Tax=Quercus lobata TaxID=97700 RepID=A0A7N2N844_QUELO
MFHYHDLTKYKEPTSLFEHLIVVGLHPDANLEIVEDVFAKRKKWQLQMANSEILEFKKLQHLAPSIPTLEPQLSVKEYKESRLLFRAVYGSASKMDAKVAVC